MSEEKEYNSVLLAALLHDVGKMLHRRRGGDGISHEKAAGRFIAERWEKLDNRSLYDLSKVKFIIESHHGSKKNVLARDDVKEISGGDPKRLWKLISIVKRADSYSCAERDQKQETRPIHEMRRASLDSIFSRLTLGAEGGAKRRPSRYHLTPLSPINSFPVDIDLLGDKEIEDLIEEFIKNIPDFKQFEDFDSVLNVWADLLQRYTWAVPSDTRYQTSDVSLFDHLRSTAAIAACLYKRHAGALDRGVRFDRINEFIFVGGDFSGIQSYIFDIANVGAGGISKRLRARSFFISMFSEITSHKILHALGLPLVCNLFSAGGKFLLIAPNLGRGGGQEGTGDILARVKREIEDQIHRQFFGQFSFLMAWLTIKGFKAEFRVDSFFETADKLFNKLDRERNRKLSGVLIGGVNGNGSEWAVEAFKATEIYEKYSEWGDCKVCGKGPGNVQDKTREGSLPNQVREEIVQCCSTCYAQKNIIGAGLPKSRFIAFGRTLSTPPASGKRVVVFEAGPGTNSGGAYYFDLLKELEWRPDYYLIYDIEGGGRPYGANGYPLAGKFLANHIPTDPDGNVLTFEEIAKCCHGNGPESDEDKRDMLGVLKADVDNLGLLFSKGFDTPAREEEALKDKQTQRKSISRFLTLSRMTELFFAGWMKQIMSDVTTENTVEALLGESSIDRKRFEKYLKSGRINFKYIYTVYSGGDDLVVVGPWETMIIFAMLLNSRFRAYTGNNPSITLSAGLAFIKPKLPVGTAIRQADELLSRAKSVEGKDCLTLFDTTVKWEDLPELVDFFLFLDDRTGDKKSPINTSFLYRLLSYQNIAKSYIHGDSVAGLRCLGLLSYDIGRNIIRHLEGGEKPQRGQDEHLELSKLVNVKPFKQSIWRGLQIPVSWCIYRNRGASEYRSQQNANQHI